MPLKVLAVDDGDESLASLLRAIESPEVELHSRTEAGPAALQSAQSIHPDLVLVAVSEPVVEQIDTIRLLAQGAPNWTVTALVQRPEPELFRELVLAGARDVLVRGASGDDLRESLQRARHADRALRGSAGETRPPAPGAIVAVTGAKGGVGKTTVAVNLAAALVRATNARVVLVDLDLRNGDVASVLGLGGGGTVQGALTPNVLGNSESLRAQLVAGPSGVAVLAADPTSSPVGSVDPARVRSLLCHLATLYDVVVVDSGAGLPELAAAAEGAASDILLVTTPDPLSIRRTQRWLAAAPPGDRGRDVRVVLNRAGGRSGLRERNVEAFLGRPIDVRIRDDADAVKSPGEGRPAGIAAADTDLGDDVERIARGLDAAFQRRRHGGPPPKPRRSYVARLLRNRGLMRAAGLTAGALAILFAAGAFLGPTSPIASQRLVAPTVARRAPVNDGAPNTQVNGAAPSSPQPAAAPPQPAAASAQPTVAAPRVTAVAAAALPTATQVNAVLGAAATQTVTPLAAAPLSTATVASASATATPPAPTTTPTVKSIEQIDERFADARRGWPNDARSTAWLGDGGYRLQARQAGRFVAVTPAGIEPTQDAVVTAAFRKVGGPPGGGYGVIVRDQSPTPRDGRDQSGRYLVFEVGDRGEIGAWSRDGDRWVDLVPWSRSSAVRADRERNELTVRATGAGIVFLVNGLQVANVRDGAPAAGRVGVFVGGDGNDVFLESFSVRPIA